VHITGLKKEEHVPLYSTDNSIALAAAVHSSAVEMPAVWLEMIEPETAQ
jgi:hypothetical protein